MLLSLIWKSFGHAKRFGGQACPLYSPFRPSSSLKLSNHIAKRLMASDTSSERVDDYPTRSITHAEVFPRKDPVIWGRHGKDGLMNEDEFNHFEKKGFVILKDVFTGTVLKDLTEDVARRRDEMEVELMASDRDCYIKESRSGMFLPEVKSERLRSVFQTYRHIPLINKAARHPQLLASIKQLLDDDVYIAQDRINFQAAFYGEGFEWHSDFETWHAEDGIPRIRTVSTIVMLSKNLPENGCLMVMPGSHEHFIGCSGEAQDTNWATSLQGQYYGIPDREILKEFGEKYGIQYCVGDPGTVVIFDSNMIHGSHNNISHMDRSNLYLVYNAVSNKPQQPFSGSTPRPEFLSTRDTKWMIPLTPAF